MSKLSILAVLSVLLLSFGSLALAEARAAEPSQPATDVTAAEEGGAEAGRHSFFLGGNLVTALVVIGAAYGISKIGSSAVENMARQPEVAGNVQTAMIVAGALIEGITFFALLVCLLELYA